MNINTTFSLIISVTVVFLSACGRSSEGPAPVRETDAKYVGQAVGNFSADEWYPGGRLGTTDDITAGSYENETPATSEAGLMTAFNLGEAAFERNFTIATEPFKGLGPAYVRSSCMDCHPGYGHGKWQDTYKASYGNGYLLVIYHPVDGADSNDGPYVSEVTGMPQTKAVYPFLPPVDEDQVSITWRKVEAMESGLPLTFPDGTAYELIYPEVFIPESAFNTDPKPQANGAVAFRLESTIGIPGSGLLDAIPQDSIKAQYVREASHGASLNPNFWDAEAGDFAPGAYYSLAEGQFADGTPAPAGTKMVKRFTYAMTRASLQDGAGANAVWNITNVSRGDRPYLYTTAAWARAMSETPSVIEAIKADPDSPYYADGTDEGIAEAVRGLLDPSTNQFDNKWHNAKVEMSDDQFYNFMVWHRGLAIPRARDLNDSEVQRGKEVFNAIGCARCHRAEWNTASDNYWTPAILKDRPLPRYQEQKIYPYTDLIHHRLFMAKDIHGTWCRTTPLWGRGLSRINTGEGNRLHDLRARTVEEAIMWHGYSRQSDAYKVVESFYNLSTADREAVVRFVESI